MLDRVNISESCPCSQSPAETSSELLIRRVEQYKALGDLTRLRLALVVKDAQPAPVCACSFFDAFDMSQSTISHHLSRLVKAGILEREQRGKWAYFTFDPEFDQSLLGGLKTGITMNNGQSENGKTILFACRQNAGRSQIAAALAKQLAPKGVTILSAGSDPADEVHPVVVEALAELGLEPDSKPKPLDPTQVKVSDWVVTMGCGEACPYFPGVHYEDWEVTDPSGKTLEEVRPIVAEIRGRVETLLKTVADEM